MQRRILFRLSAAPHPLLKVFFFLSLLFSLHSKLASNSKGPWLEIPDMIALAMRETWFLFKWIYQNSFPVLLSFGCPKQTHVTPKECFWALIPPQPFPSPKASFEGTDLTDSCLSLNTCVLLPLWNVFLFSAVISPSYILYCWQIPLPEVLL